MFLHVVIAQSGWCLRSYPNEMGEINLYWRRTLKNNPKSISSDFGSMWQDEGHSTVVDVLHAYFSKQKFQGHQV
jgi:hypothetical protein